MLNKCDLEFLHIYLILSSILIQQYPVQRALYVYLKPLKVLLMWLIHWEILTCQGSDLEHPRNKHPCVCRDDFNFSPSWPAEVPIHLLHSTNGFCGMFVCMHVWILNRKYSTGISFASINRLSIVWHLSEALRNDLRAQGARTQAHAQGSWPKLKPLFEASYCYVTTQKISIWTQTQLSSIWILFI